MAGINLPSLVGLCLGGVILIACWQLLSLVWHRYRGIRTIGKVVKLQEEKMYDDTEPVFAPIVEYRRGEQTCRIKSLIAMAPALYKVGQEVPVYYFAQSAASGRVVTPREFIKWIVVILSCLLFLAMLANIEPAH